MVDKPIFPIHTRVLLTKLAPALAAGRLSDAKHLIEENWSVAQLVELIDKKTNCMCDARKVATAALGLVGDRTAIAPLAVALHDQDIMIVQMAEHALWNIWFRLGKCSAICQVKKGCCHLDHGNFDQACEHFTTALLDDPDFAEAYHQRALAHYLAERYQESLTDCQAALDRMPQHFGAMSGLGNAHAQLRHWCEARKCYRLALAMHPHMDSVPQALAQIEEIIAATTPSQSPPPPSTSN